MTTTWQSYRRLLNQLHSKDTALPLETISSAISHHLIFASPPTQLTASVVVSPLFVNGSFDRLNALQIAFRHAVLLQNKPQDEANSSIFTSIFRLDARTRLSQWLRLVLQGLQGGAPVSRLMCYCGLMCGLGDLRVQLQTPDVDSVVNSAVLTRLQGELVLALAEVLDLYYPSNDGSEPHWLIQFHSQHSKDIFLASICLISPALLLLSEVKFSVLPLPLFGHVVLQCINETFSQGESAPPTYLLQSMAPVSRLLSRIVTVLYSSSGPRAGLELAQTTLTLFDSLAPAVSEAPHSQEGFSKTFLFVILAVADGILSNVVYVPPKLYQNRPPTPAHLAAQTIWCLLHLSDIVAALGGVSPTSGGGVKELQRTFHFAVDILCDPNSGARETLPAFVRDICGVAIEKTERMSVVLNIIEFLVPVLLDSAEGRSILDGVVWNACKMHLDAPKESRQLYESAHSVVLSIFAADAQHRIDDTTYHFDFARKLVLDYATSLIKNSQPDHLSNAQLCLAYGSLVRSAAAGRSSEEMDSCWLPLQPLIEAIIPAEAERRHRLSLALIHCVPNLPQPLMGRALEHVKEIISSEADQARKEELRTELFDQILDEVGDEDKVFAMRWWFEKMQVEEGGEVADDFIEARL